MDKDEIFDYVMETPQNTNPSILRDMLNRLDTSDGLPEVDESDNGKVLTVSSGTWSAENPPESLPDVTSEDNGKVLTVVSGDWEAVKTIWYGPYYFTNKEAYNTLSSDTKFDVRLNKITDLEEGYYELPSEPLQNQIEIRVIDINFNLITDGDGSAINGVSIPYTYYDDSDDEYEGWYWSGNIEAHLVKFKDPQAGITSIPAEGIIVGFLINVELNPETNA